MKIEAPSIAEPFLMSDGTMNPLWYAFITKRGVLDMPDVDASAGITNAQVLVFNGPAKKFRPGSN